MLNMDMVGRLKKDEPVLILSGTGTSPRWKTLVDSIETDQVEIKATESGVGPSYLYVVLSAEYSGAALFQRHARRLPQTE